ncbi:MAG: hypothetical protein AAF490_03315, partial [Chloroflexota bacterium]
TGSIWYNLPLSWHVLNTQEKLREEVKPSYLPPIELWLGHQPLRTCVVAQNLKISTNKEVLPMVQTLYDSHKFAFCCRIILLSSAQPMATVFNVLR